MTEKEIIIKMIKEEIKKRRKWKTEDEQWWYLIEQGTNDILFYTSGRFPEMKVSELAKIIFEIREETKSYRTLINEIYKNK